MSHPRQILAVWIMLAGSIPLVGCGSGGSAYELATVTGVVTLDGSKLKDGRVVFFNKNGFNETADIKSDGSYSIQTAVGETQVFIDHREQATKALEDRPSMLLPGKSLVPVRYADSKTSGLILSVSKGTNKFDISMTK